MYALLIDTPIEIRIGTFEITKPLLLWINDGLMAGFFFLVGLELKRELIEGELSNRRKIILPGVGAIGGMLVPALIYTVFNAGDEIAMKGWAVPAATDIGKMGIPDEILKKEEALTEIEWEIIKTYPRLAFEMLKNIEYLKPALDIPCSYHEQWDGLGYLEGLAGEEIPIAARIFSLVDNWDALTSDRPYRLAWSEEETKAYILSESGKKFDPELVPFFIEMISKS